MAKKKTIEDLKKEQAEALNKYKLAQDNGDTTGMMFWKDKYDSLATQIERAEIYSNMTPEQKQAAKDKPITAKEIIGGLTSGFKAYGEDLKSSIKDDPLAYQQEKEKYENIFGSGATTEETPVTEIEETIETPTEEVPGTVDNMATEETPASTETKTPERKTFDWRRSAEDLSRYGGALYDSITAMHKRKANQAVALSGFGGAYGSTQKPFTEEETIAPLSNIRKQAYENYISNMQATQDALNNVTRTDIKNKYKSVYDIDAANTTDRQAYATQVIGAIQNKLNIDLNRDIMSMKKEELQSYLEEIKSDFETLKNEIKDKGLKDALSTALPMFIQILNKGSLEQALLQANINTVGNATTSIGNLLGQLALNGLK